MEQIAWISTLCLAFCGIPLAIASIARGHANGVNPTFLVLWFTGELFGTIYTVHIDDRPLMANYIFNLLMITIVLRYKLCPRT